MLCLFPRGEGRKEGPRVGSRGKRGEMLEPQGICAHSFATDMHGAVTLCL